MTQLPHHGLGCYITLWCAIAILTVACTSPLGSLGKQPGPVDVEDGGLLKHEGCELPCFWGIVPGATSLTETVNIFERKNLSAYCSSNLDQYSRLACDDIAIIVVNPENDRVSSVGVDPANPITIGDVISLYGQPNAVLITPDGVPEHPYTTMMVFFDNIRTRIILARQEGTVYKVNSSVSLDNISYYDADSYKTDEQHAIDWNGYGEYQETPIH